MPSIDQVMLFASKPKVNSVAKIISFISILVLQGYAIASYIYTTILLKAMITIVFTYANGSKRILKTRAKEARNFIKDMVHDFGAEKAHIG